MAWLPVSKGYQVTMQHLIAIGGWNCPPNRSCEKSDIRNTDSPGVPSLHSRFNRGVFPEARSKVKLPVFAGNNRSPLACGGRLLLCRQASARERVGHIYFRIETELPSQATTP